MIITRTIYRRCKCGLESRVSPNYNAFFSHAYFFVPFGNLKAFNAIANAAFIRRGMITAPANALVRSCRVSREKSMDVEFCTCCCHHRKCTVRKHENWDKECLRDFPEYLPSVTDVTLKVLGPFNVYKAVNFQPGPTPGPYVNQVRMSPRLGTTMIGYHCCCQLEMRKLYVSRNLCPPGHGPLSRQQLRSSGPVRAMGVPGIFHWWWCWRGVGGNLL